MRWNKKADTVAFEATIFIVLNILFIAVLLIFVYSSGKGAFIYEQMYAKQVVLLIDNAEPNMTIFLDMEKGIEIAKENKKPEEKIIVIDKDRNMVSVSLSEKGGHSYQYFSDYDVSAQFTGGYLTIKIIEESENE